MPTDLFLTSPIVTRPTRHQRADTAFTLVIALSIALLLLVAVLKAPIAGTPDQGAADEPINLLGP